MTIEDYRWSKLPVSPRRRRARSAILAAVDEHPSLEGAALLAVIDAAYPFGERAHHPYRMWLIERRLALAALAAPAPPTLPSRDEADVCVVARDMVEEGRLDDARKLLEQAPNRLARECPACGAKPRKPCWLSKPMPQPHTTVWHGINLSVELLVPHHARLVGHLDAGPLFQGRRETCSGCGHEIDPETCHCGTSSVDHAISDGHSPVPMGCRCHEAPP